MIFKICHSKCFYQLYLKVHNIRHAIPKGIHELCYKQLTNKIYIKRDRKVNCKMEILNFFDYNCGLVKLIFTRKHPDEETGGIFSSIAYLPMVDGKYNSTEITK